MLMLINTILVIVIYLVLVGFLFYYMLGKLKDNSQDDDQDGGGGWEIPRSPKPVDLPPSQIQPIKLKKEKNAHHQEVEALEHELA
ncbi:MAG: hypothetical protein OHK0038_15100 [Flammeovirgaceae bacterium]